MTNIAVDAQAHAAPLARPDPVTSLLRAEGAVAFAAALAGYRALDCGWPLFAALVLLPDLSMLGYGLDRRFGARLYNAGHTYLAPAALALAGWIAGAPTPCALALIWVAHIGLDRALGFGLKRPGSFGDTHLGSVGRSDAARPSPRR